MLVQADGKLVVAGTSKQPRSEMVVTRLKSDGAPDLSWDGDGHALAGFDAASEAHAATLQPDGKIVVAGMSANGLDFAAARFDPTGKLDASFGSRGRVTVGGGFVEIALAAALQPYGRIVLAGIAVGGAPVVRLQGDPPPTGGGNGGGGAVGDDPGGPIADRAPPVLGSLSLTSRRFRVGRRPRGAARRVPSGTAFGLTLSEAAAVTFTIQRKAAGRRRSGRCEAVTRRNRRARRCTRHLMVGSFARSLDAGRARVAFSGRLSGLPATAGELQTRRPGPRRRRQQLEHGEGRVPCRPLRRTAFAADGRTKLPFDGFTVATGPAVQRDGKIVIAGVVAVNALPRVTVARLLGDPPCAPAGDVTLSDTGPFPQPTRTPSATR